MSGSRPTVAIRVTAENADKTRADLERIGTTGEAALKRVQAASAMATPEMQRLASASDVAQRAFTGLGGSLGRVGAVATNVSGVAGVLATGFIALGAAAGVAAVNIAKAGDAATGTLARLASATGSMAQAQQVYEGLFRLSQQTGVAVTESAGAFSRFSVAAREIGGTSDQVLRLVSGIQKAGIVAGSGAQESAAAVQQLGQALASGVLQGDELRSILENMPQLAQSLAREMGVSIARLREMGTEGKLTADVVFPALLRATEKIGEEFDKMPVTMSRAKDILIAATDDFGARLDRITGLSQTFAKFMQQGAAALNAAGAYIAPTDREANAQAISRLETERGRLRERASNADSEIAAYMASGMSREQALSLAMPALPGQTGGGDGARLAAIEKELADHYQRRFQLMLDAQTREQAEQHEADRQRQESARQRADQNYKKIREDFDKEFKARKEHKERLDAIDKAEATGAITTAQAQADRKKVNDDLAESLQKLAGAHKAVGKEAAEADAHVKEFLKDQEKQAEAAARAQEKAADAMRRYHERSFDELVSIGERAFDRLGDALVEAFVSGSGAAVNFGNVARAIAASVITDFAKLALVNPILNSLFTSSSGPRPTLSAALGGGGGVGLGDVLGLSSLIPRDGLLGSLGLSGAGAGLSASIFGTAGVSPATASLFMDASGVAASAVPGSAGMFGTYGTSLMGGSSLTLGGAFGSIGGGLAISSFLNSAMGRSSAQSTNGMIGSGLGGLAGFLIGGPLGGLIGGTLGGLGGGLIGPGESVRGYGFRLQSANYDEATGGGGLSSSLLPISRQFYNDSGAAAFAQAEQLVAATNAYLSQRGLLVGGASVVGGNKNGADYSWADAGSLEEAFTRLRFGAANDNTLGSALSGRTFSGLGDLQAFVEGYSQVRDTIAELTDTHAEKLDRALEAVNKQFDDLAAKARTYGLAEDGLAQARERALQATRNASSEQADALLRDLTFGRSSALAPEQRYFAALTTLNQARQDLDAGGNAASYASIAQQVLPVARDYLGTSQRYAALVADVAAAVRTAGGGSESSATLSALLSAQVEGAQMNAEIGSLTASEIRALRGSMDRLSATMQAILTRQQAA